MKLKDGSRNGTRSNSGHRCARNSELPLDNPRSPQRATAALARGRAASSAAAKFHKALARSERCASRQAAFSQQALSRDRARRAGASSKGASRWRCVAPRQAQKQSGIDATSKSREEPREREEAEGVPRPTPPPPRAPPRTWPERGAAWCPGPSSPWSSSSSRRVHAEQSELDHLDERD